ncbi:hypothetical protein CsSME_00018301 [Camellia sinensis var. sinensis]
MLTHSSSLKTIQAACQSVAMMQTLKLPFCQIRGKYRMELPGYNTMDPYPHMNERCPSLPPKYSRPKGC